MNRSSRLLSRGVSHWDFSRKIRCLSSKLANRQVPSFVSMQHSSVAAHEQVYEPENTEMPMTEIVEETQAVAIEEIVSPTHLTYTGQTTIPITSTLRIVPAHEDAPSGTWPVFRILDESGKVRDPMNDSTSSPAQSRRVNYVNADQRDISTKELTTLRDLLQQNHPTFNFLDNPLLQSAEHDYPDTGNKDTLLRGYLHMIRLREMDTILQNAQRQGRISFYMTCRGEEAIHIGSAAALSNQDTVLAQYREAGLLMWRGFTLQQFADQCFSNVGDLGKGRQMPVHYGSRALNYQTISSPLGTQLIQAVGAGYRTKLQNKPAVTIVFFGDGCSSSVDFHSACNFAATLQVPVIFFCRNNGYAISTPVTEQYAGDGVISRCKGYGMAGIRIDGNDMLAVSAAVKEARSYALEHNAPVMIEAMTYRQGHHSTSDDSSRYRSNEEVKMHSSEGDPLARMRSFLKDVSYIEDFDTKQMADLEKQAVLKAMETAEHKSPPLLSELFQDVYKTIPKHLEEQEKMLLQHLEAHKDNYAERTG